MALKDKFKAVNIQSGNVVTFVRTDANTFSGEWTCGKREGNYATVKEHYAENVVQGWLIDGTLFMHKDEQNNYLPNKFFFTTSMGTRYTAYIQDELVTVAWGEGVQTETLTYTLDQTKKSISEGYWHVLPESYRTPASVAAEFMEFMQAQGEIVNDQDRVALAQTIVLLNKVMYGK